MASLWGVAAAAYLNLARTAYPGLHLAHLTNEPNSNWFRHSQHMVSDFAAFFAEAAAVIKRDVPGMKLGGPVLCWPVAESWGWVPALIDSSLPSGLLDFVDFHAYGEHEARRRRAHDDVECICCSNGNCSDLAFVWQATQIIRTVILRGSILSVRRTPSLPTPPLSTAEPSLQH
eukprot:SAG22_NODE_594_length_8738_cov_20.249219_3_plen_174_part_00